MSDGPHRSLPMRLAWRRVAERCDKGAFSADEIGRAIFSALEKDCRDELNLGFLGRVRAALQQDPWLFNDVAISRILALRNEANGIGTTFLENLVELSYREAAEVDSMLEALIATLTDQSTRCSRQVEEHYLRKSTAPRANNVRVRLEQGIAGTSFETLARQVLGLEQPRPEDGALKQKGLDDGVDLR